MLKPDMFRMSWRMAEVRPNSPRDNPASSELRILETGVLRRYCPTMPMEFYQGRPLEPKELEAIRQQIERFDTIEAVDHEIRGIIERNWPHLVHKLPPEEL